jgi:hypothetical protein
MAAQGVLPLVRVAMAHDLVAQGEPGRALVEADAVLADAPGLVEALLLRASALRALGQLAEAATVYRAALAAEPGRPAAHVNLGNVCAELGQLTAAEASLRRALALDPAHRAAHASLITVYGMTNRDDLLLAACEAALAVDPDGFNAHQHLAALRARAGDHAAARRHREAAYRRHNLFVEPACRPAPTALVLLSAEDGNVPLRYLISRDRYRVIKWLVEYATPGQAAALPPYDIVFNAIGEPDLGPAPHEAAELFRAGCAAPFLNRPDRVLRTSRAGLPDLLGDLADVVVPRCLRWQAGEPAPALDWPVLVRPVGSHGGTGLVRIEDAAWFAAEAHAACHVTAFHNFASADRLFRKYRMIFIDRRPLPYHLAIGDHWLVHYFSAAMLEDAARRAEEQHFLDHPAEVLGPRAMGALHAIGARLDLDYGGIDFALLPDGRVLVFEANATMVVHPEAEDGVLAHKNKAVADILAAFDAMVAARLQAAATSPLPAMA